MCKIQLSAEQLSSLTTRIRGNKPNRHFGAKSHLSVAEALRNTGESPRDILPLHHRDATIAVVCGKQPSGKGYVAGAYFDSENARIELQRYAAQHKGDEHGFVIVEANIGHLEELAVVNPLTRELFSEIDRLAVYSLLTEKLR